MIEDNSTLFQATNIFNGVFESKTVEEISFSRHWKDPISTINYRQATKLKLSPGERRKAIDVEKNRKIILVGSRIGTFVVFERFAIGNHYIYFANIPNHCTVIARLIDATAGLSPQALEKIIGNQWGEPMNIGESLEVINKYFQTSSTE